MGYGQYTKAFDLHMTELIINVASLKPFELSDYHHFDDRTLLILPEEDTAFSQEAQADLSHSMPRAKVVRVSCSDTATLYKVDEHVKETKNFLETILP